MLTLASSHLPQSIKDELLAKTPSTRLGDPENIAAMVAMLLSKDGAWINGQAFGVDGGYYMR